MATIGNGRSVNFIGLNIRLGFPGEIEKLEMNEESDPDTEELNDLVVDCAVVAKILLQKLEKLTSPLVSFRRPFAQCHY